MPSVTVILSYVSCPKATAARREYQDEDIKIDPNWVEHLQKGGRWRRQKQEED